MGFIAGFILGVLASVIASFLFRCFEIDVPLVKQKRMMAFLRSPALFIRLRLNTDERRIKELIERLFLAWERKDLDAYSSCWAADAVRVVGSESPIKEDKRQIVEKFQSSCQKYSVIKVLAIVFDKISIGPRPGTAIAMVHYRFDLVRESDGIPKSEDSQEVYLLKFRNGSWQILSNMDHCYVIGPRNN